MKIAEAYVDISVKTAPFKKQLSGLETATKKTTQNIQQRFKTLAPTFRKVGIGMAVAGGAITAALGLTIKSAMSFNKEMANIATLIPGATERVIELKTAIRGMAVVVGKSTADLAQGAYQVISAFGDTADTVNILEMSAKAATAGVATTTEAINLLSAVTKGYGDTSKEAVKKASDLAFQTVTLGQTTFPELAASIGRAIPLAAELGVVEEELFTVMATGTGVTGKAAEVSTQLRGIFQSLMAPTADMTKLLESMGYESGKAMLAEEGLHGALISIVKAAKDSNTPLQKYISQIEGQTLALALTGAQSDVYIEKLAKMRDSVGLTDVAFREQTEGINKAGFAFEQAKIRIGVLGQEIGDRLLPMITPLIEKITDLVKKMSDWAKEHPKLSSGIVKFAAVLGPLLLGLGGLLIILPNLIALIPLLKIGMIKLGAAFHFMLGPIGLIIIAIGAAVAAFLYFYKTSDKFRNFIDKIVAYIKAFVQNAWNRLIWLRDNWGKLWKTIFEAIPKIAKNSFDNLMAIFNWVWDFIKGWGSWLGKNFINIWKNMFGAISTSVKNFGDNIWAQLKWIGEKMKPKNWFKKIERPDWTPLLEGFEAVWEEMPKIAGVQLKKMADGVKVYFEPLPEIIKPVFKAVKEGAKEAGDAVDKLLTATEKYITKFDEIRKLRKTSAELADELKRAAEEALKLGLRIGKYDYATLLVAANNAARDLADELKRASEKAFLLGLSLGKYDYTTLLVAANNAARDLADELKKANEKATKLGWTFGKYDYSTLLVASNQAARDLADELKKANEKALKLGWTFGKYDYATLLVAANNATRDLVDELKKANEKALKLGWTLGKYDYATLLVAANQAARDLADELKKASEEAFKLGWQIGKFDYATLLVAANQAARDLADELKKANEEALKLGWAFGKYDYVTLLVAANNATRDLRDELKKAGENALKLGWTIGKFDYATLLVAARQAQGGWNVEIKKTTATWEKIKEATGDYFSSFVNWGADAMNALAGVIDGTKTLGEAIQELAYGIPILGGILEGIVNIGIAIVDWITGVAATKRAMSDMLVSIGKSTKILEGYFKDVGASLTGSIEEAERAIKSLMQTQEDLALNTREKLIKELDNYYDYRVLREMDLTQLLALSAETREKLEKSTLESIAETAEEVAEREKDAKVGTLQAIEDAYAKESALINKKIGLLEVEIKLLMAAALAEQGNLAAAEKLRAEALKDLRNLLYTKEEQLEMEEELRKALKRTEDQTGKMKEAIEKATGAAKEFGREGREAADKARIGIEQWGKEISKIPRRIDFDIVGDLHMPSIPRVRDQSFNIWGDYRAPNIPSYQVGIPNVPRTQVAVIHKKEAVLNASQAEDWRAGRGGAVGGGTQVTYERGAIRMTVMGNLNNQMDLEEAMDYLAKKQTEKMRRP